MNCNCIKKLTAALEKKYGKGNVELDLRMLINLETGKTAMVPGPPLTFKYHDTLPSGKVAKNWIKSYIEAAYCAFCGKRCRRKAGKKNKEAKL